MSTYKNGQIPAGILITIASGTDENGYWEHQLTAGTLAKHNKLVTLGKQKSGRTLQITPGWNAFRPIPAQETAFRVSPPGNAATPGMSSHGGEYQGADMMAVDYGNAEWVFGSREAFYAACREVGFEPGLFSWEIWHVVDRDPYRPAPAGGWATPFNPEEDDMYDAQAEQRLMDRLDRIEKMASKIKVFTWGTGLVAYDPDTGRVWPLPAGYDALLEKLGVGRAVAQIGDPELGFLTASLPDLLTRPSDTPMSADDLARIKAAVGEGRVVLSQTQLDQLLTAVGDGARSGGEAGAKAALQGVTFVTTIS